MKIIKKITFIILSCLLIMNLNIPVIAKTDASKKEEVVYVKSDDNGNVESIDVVNSFTSKSVTDYGDYSSVKMLNTDDQITQDGDKITYSTSKDKTYYQGSLESAEIPWNISILYYLDGKEINGENLAGKSGNLEIKFKITENTNCDSSFYDNYALQASFTLDTNKCSDIVANDATIANVGENKQLTYTILPGKGIDTTITAKVKDFEMDAVTINGIHLNLNFDIDTSSLKEKVNTIIDAIDTLNDGAETLNDGTTKISKGATKVKKGASDVSNGAAQVDSATDSFYKAISKLDSKTSKLNSGVSDLLDGANTLSTGLNALSEKGDTLTSGAYSAFEGLCSASTTLLNQQLQSYGMDSVTLTPENYSTVLMNLLSKLGSENVYNTAYNQALVKVTAEVEEKEDTLYSSYIEQNADTIYTNYMLSKSESLYTSAATQAVISNLINNGYSESEANSYVQTSEGQALVKQAYNNLSEDQKTQIISSAVSSLSEEQKTQIKQTALQSLTTEQKEQIKQAYIQQLMASDDVIDQITQAVTKADEASGEIASLKGQLDQYNTFYVGLNDYVGYVNESAEGASALASGLDTLYKNTNTLSTSIHTLYIKLKDLVAGTESLKDGSATLEKGAVSLNKAIKSLSDGTKSLVEGTEEFKEKASTANSLIDDSIASILDSIRGNDEVKSFVSSKNKDVTSVQFVIKTSSIEKEEVVQESETEEDLTFIQKVLRLFGID